MTRPAILSLGATAPPPFGAREVKLLSAPLARVTETGEFEGYASLFGVPDLGKDIVMRGAFRDSLARRGPSGVRLLWQHDPAEPIGRWLSLVEDETGLRVRGQLNRSVARAREILALMRDGALDGLSIGFRVDKAQTDPRGGYRRLFAVDLWEISIVTFPLLPAARVAAVKRAPAAPLPAEQRLVRAIDRAARCIARRTTPARSGSRLSRQTGAKPL